MACILYDKEGNPHRIKVERLSAALESGLLRDNPLKPRIVENKDPVKAESVDELEAELHDQEEDVAEAEQAIRDRAKELGINHYWTKKVENLLDEIEALEGQEDASED